MISDREWFLVSNILVPNPQFLGSYKYDSFVWTDSRPYPTQAEINQANIDFTEQQDKEAGVEAAKVAYETAMAQGYTHTDGVTYHANERAVMDLCMVTVLNTLEEDEPVYMMSMSHGIVSMTLAQFRDLAVLIGRHTYSLRQDYWEALMALQG